MDTAHPPVRLCEVTKWQGFKGLGFQLNSTTKTWNHTVSKVDPGSPAEAAGLKPKDIIIEVNNVNVTRKNHKQLIDLIKSSSGNSTKILVADEKCKVTKC